MKNLDYKLVVQRNKVDQRDPCGTDKAISGGVNARGRRLEI